MSIYSAHRFLQSGNLLLQTFSSVQNSSWAQGKISDDHKPVERTGSDEVEAAFLIAVNQTRWDLALWQLLQGSRSSEMQEESSSWHYEPYEAPGCIAAAVRNAVFSVIVNVFALSCKTKPNPCVALNSLWPWCEAEEPFPCPAVTRLSNAACLSTA